MWLNQAVNIVLPISVPLCFNAASSCPRLGPHYVLLMILGGEIRIVKSKYDIPTCLSVSLILLSFSSLSSSVSGSPCSWCRARRPSSSLRSIRFTSPPLLVLDSLLFLAWQMWQSVHQEIFLFLITEIFFLAGRPKDEPSCPIPLYWWQCTLCFART